MLIRITRTVAAGLACVLAAVGGVVLAVAAPVALVGTTAIGTIVGLIVATQLPDAGPLAPPRRRRATGIGAAAAAATVFALLAIVGAIAILGAAAGPLFLVLLAVVAAGLWRHRAAWRAYATAVTRAAGPPRPADTAIDAPWPPDAAPPIGAGAPTVRALCAAWRHSHWVLQSLPAGPTRSELIATRERLLDELELRDPVGFRRWLHRGVRTSSDPGHYLTENRTTPTRTGSPRGPDDGRRRR